MRKFSMVNKSGLSHKGQCGPPEPPAPVSTHIVIALASLFLMALATPFIAMAFPSKGIYLPLIFFTLGIPAFFFNRAEYRHHAALRASYPQRLKEWNASWLCMACGEATRTE